jgi:hypothetical protein
MPIRKLRGLPEYDDGLWLDPADPRLLPTIVAVWERSRRLSPPSFPPGVYKHASIEDANRMTERWEREAIERARGAATPRLQVPLPRHEPGKG